MIPFNKPAYTGNEDAHVLLAMQSRSLSGNGENAGKCQTWFCEKLKCVKTLLTPSCTHALEMAAILLEVQAGDEIIMPSFTFVSTANAFVLRGAKIVFVDIRPDTMNIDEKLIERAISSRTKAIVPVHYAGVACDMDGIVDIAERNDIYVIEDAAQGMMATYKSRPLGSIGHLGAYSFHETKNYTSGGEGGLLIINKSQFAERAEIIREKGTNRSQFFRGMVDKYSWVDVGSSYLPSELQAAYLLGQLESANVINKWRLDAWQRYYDSLQPLAESGRVELPFIPSECEHNGHMFYLKVADLDERTRLIEFLRARGVYAVFHYVPLHSAVGGQRYAIFSGEDRYTTAESERLIRLPLWYGIMDSEIDQIVASLESFFLSNLKNHK